MRLARALTAVCGVALAAWAGFACSAGTVQPGSLTTAANNGDSPNTTGPGSQDPLEPNATPGDANLLTDGNQPNGGNDSNDATSGNGTVPADGNATRLWQPGVAMYYGTGNNQGRDPDLATLCQDGDISIIILSFVDAIASYSTNENGNPHMSINGCEGSWNAQNRRLQRCPTLGTKVTACQQAGKQVVLSMGGAGAQVGFLSDEEAESYAQLMWDMFLGGNGNIRPFGDATLDGIDLDIENGTSVGYAAFVLRLRALMDATPKSGKPWLITAAPQCPFPDDWIGPDGTRYTGSGRLSGTALTRALPAFDHLFVQFYNNGCAYDDPTAFANAWRKWTSIGSKQPYVWVGLPAAVDAVGGNYAGNYIAGDHLADVVTQLGAGPLFGGFMFWDAGYDADTINAGKKPIRASAAEAVAGLPAR